MVAIIVTMILMFVITLIVLGFSEATRRNQREALDTQLGQQAYYAAETGVNDITSLIKGGVALTNNSTCTTSYTLYGAGLPRQLTADGSVANTCLMVTAQPDSLEVDNISSSSGSVMWHVQNSSGAAFKTLAFGWSPDATYTNATNTCSAGFGAYPSRTNWLCDRALLRVDILPATFTSTDADYLAGITTTLYLQPYTGVQKDLAIGAFGNPAAKQGACRITGAAPAGCTVSVDVSAAGVSAADYYVRITALYIDAKTVTLSGTDASGATQFSNGQIVVDSTGRAQDQIKRIKVRIPLTQPDDSLPIYAAQSAGSTCKDMTFNVGFVKQGVCASYLTP
jgi:Tfp pilus assembly protein PilX